MKTVAVIMARMGSTRLPGKAIIDLAGKPALTRIIERVKRAKTIDYIAIATTTLEAENPIRNIARGMFCYCHSGSEGNVLGRVFNTAIAAEADIIVDITADCPLIDPEIIDQVTQAIKDDPTIDCSSNWIERSYPDGMDVKAYSREAFKKLNMLIAEGNPIREHAGYNFMQFPDIFKLKNLCAPDWAHFPEMRLTLDTIEDYHLISAIYDFFQDRPMGLKDILNFLQDNPELLKLNRNIIPKEPLK